MPWASCYLLPSKYIQRYHYNNNILLKSCWNIGKRIHTFRWIRAFYFEFEMHHNTRSNHIKIFSQSTICWLVDSFVSWSFVSLSINQSINQSFKKTRKITTMSKEIGNAIQTLRIVMKTFALIVVRVIDQLNSIIQRCGKVLSDVQLC